MSEVFTASDAAAAEVRERVPALMAERGRLLSVGIEPTAVLLPARLNVPYEGPYATHCAATCIGLPIEWSERERWGLVVTF